MERGEWGALGAGSVVQVQVVPAGLDSESVEGELRHGSISGANQDPRAQLIVGQIRVENIPGVYQCQTAAGARARDAQRRALAVDGDGEAWGSDGSRGQRIAVLLREED